MDTTIRDLQAAKQLLSFKPLFLVSKNLTDIDIGGELVNGICFACEVKKDTLNHTAEDIIVSNQWNTYRKMMRDTTYLIYATHHEEISDDPIMTDNLIVRYVELNGQKIDFQENITLLKYLNKISSVGRYYISVKYPNKAREEYAFSSPEENENWTSEYYWSGKNTFETEEECIEYIKKRFEKEFNRPYIYSIHYADSISSAKLIHRYTYEEIIGL